MIDLEKLENNLKKKVYITRNLGEHSRVGSDHLYYRSLTMFNLGKVKKVKYQEKPAFEVICKYDIYTETEFLHSPEMDELYTEHYKDKFIFDQDLEILEIKDVRSR